MSNEKILKEEIKNLRKKLRETKKELHKEIMENWWLQHEMGKVIKNLHKYLGWPPVLTTALKRTKLTCTIKNSTEYRVCRSKKEVA